MGNDRSEFTLWQLFMGIIVIGLILCFVAYGISNLVDSFTGNLLNETTILDMVKEYVHDIESNSWKKMDEYDVYCVSVGELVNDGLLDSNVSFDDGILDSDLVIIKRDRSSMKIEEVRITDKNDNDYKICKDMLPETLYTITFHMDNIDGDSNVITKECTSYDNEGCRIKSPVIGDITGYKVIGWNKDKDASSSNWEEDTYKLVNNNQDYYAIVIPNKVTIKYNVNSGSIITSSNDVGKWKKNSNGIVLLDGDQFVTSINYGGSLDEYGLEDYNDSGRINIGRDGYYVPSGEEWKCISGCSGTYSQSKVYDYDDFCNIDKKSCEVVLGVNWKEAYTVRYSANGGSGAPGNQSKIHGESLILSSEIPTRSGYSFIEWNTKKDGSGTSYSAGSNYTENASITLYAMWKKNSSDVVSPTTYTVKYDANGGSGAPGNQTKNHGESLKLSGVKPTRSGYSFVNWNTKKDGSGTSYSAGTNYAGNASITLYAQWKKNTTVTPTPTPVTYVVSYNANGGSGEPGNQTKTHDISLVLSSVRPTRSGYTFMGWNTKKDGTGTYYNVGDTYILNANVTLYAEWMKNVVEDPTPTPTTYIVSYNANGGSGAPSSQTKTTDCIYLSSVIPTRSGYSFNGWNTSSNGSGSYHSPGTSYCGNSSITLYAQWRKNTPSTYTISYNANGGSGEPSSQTKAHDGYIYLSSVVPTRSGYTFTYWNTKPDGSGLTYTPGGLYSDNKDVVFYAQWSKNSSGGGSTGGGNTGTTHNHTHVVNAIGSTLRTVSRIKLSCGHYHTTVLYRYCSICGMSAYNISGEGMYACPCSPVYTYIFDDSKVSSYAAYKSWFGTTISSSYQLYTTSNRAKDCSAH